MSLLYKTACAKCYYNQLWSLEYNDNISERIECKLISLTYKVLPTNQAQYLQGLNSVQPCHNTRLSSMITIAGPPTRSSLKITNLIALFGMLHLIYGTDIFTDLREPRQTQSPSLSPITHGNSSLSPSSRSPLAYSLTRSVFHSELKTWVFGKSFPP